MEIRTWNIISLCCVFSVNTDDGEVRSGDIPVGTPGLGIERVWPCRRAYQMWLGGRCCSPSKSVRNLLVVPSRCVDLESDVWVEGVSMEW